MSDELKPCPFCDQKLSQESWGYSHSFKNETKCPLNGLAFLKDSKNFEAWSTRASDKRIAVLEEACKLALVAIGDDAIMKRLNNSGGSDRDAFMHVAMMKIEDRTNDEQLESAFCKLQQALEGKE